MTERRGFTSPREYSDPVLTKDRDGHVSVEWPNGKLGYTVWSDNMVEEYVSAMNTVVALRTMIDTMHENIEELTEDLKAMRRERDALKPIVQGLLTPPVITERGGPEDPIL